MMRNVIAVCLLWLSFSTDFAQEIALTFDDAPMGNGQYFTGIARTHTLIQKLKSLNVPQVAFLPSRLIDLLPKNS